MPDAPPADHPQLEAKPAARPAPPDTAAVPIGQAPRRVHLWFDDIVDAAIPAYDASLATADIAAQAYARRAKAANTRRAYRAGVRAWCAWCDRHTLPCLPARARDIGAFLAAERGRGLSVATLDLRRAALRYLHFIAGQPVPTAEAHIAETMAGIHRDAADRGDFAAKKLAATVEILRQLLAPIDAELAGRADLAGRTGRADHAGASGLPDPRAQPNLRSLRALRDRALLLIGFTGALRRSELAASRVEHLETRDRGLRLTLPRSKGERSGRSVTVAIPYGQTELCPVRALRRWLEAAGINDGPVFRRIWIPPAGRDGRQTPLPRLGSQAIDPGSVARIIQTRAAAAGFARTALGGHSLKRGALTTGMDQGIHPTRLKQLGRHKSYAVLDDYLELGDPFEGHPLAGVL